MAVGAHARLGARRDMLDAFHALRFPSALRTGTGPSQKHASTTPEFVVTSGYVAGQASNYLARREGSQVCLRLTVGAGSAGGGCRGIHLRADIEVVGTGPWAVVTGLVSRRTSSVEALLAGGQTVAGDVVQGPPILGARFDFFSVELPRRSRGTVVARGAGEEILGRRRFDPQPLPALARGGSGDTRWSLLDREQSNGVRCIDFDNGHGDQASLCPTTVPGSRDIQATVVSLLYGRPLVMGVVSDRVAYVEVRYLTPRFVPARIRPFPSGFDSAGAALPPEYRLFTARVRSIEGAIVVAYDHDSNPIDGLPLEAGQGFGD